MTVPIIDIFAGPGGLGEGFTSVVRNRKRIFRIALSIEKDPYAHQTLTLRSFLRQFPPNRFPDEYYTFLESEEKDIQGLFAKYPREARKAAEEAWLFELGVEGTYDQLDARIRKALGGQKTFVLIGGPPCQAYSLVGRSRRKETRGLNKNDPRVYLYREYYRILAVHNPPVFVMENVKGLLSSKVDDQSIFEQLLKDLENPVGSYKKLHGKKRVPYRNPGYNIFSLVRKPSETLYGEAYSPEDFVVRAEDYGIPQTRHRVVLLGIRKDVNKEPDFLQRYGKHVTVRDVLNGLPCLRSGLSREADSSDVWLEALKEIQYRRRARDMDLSVWDRMISVVEGLRVPKSGRGNEFVRCESKNFCDVSLSKWYLDSRLNGVCNHEARAHIRNDLFRYLFASCFAEVYGRSPKLDDFPKLLLPKHKNVNEDARKFNDRFRVQPYDFPSRTITSHISKDGHYYIHPDPFQCRSFTVREAARIQTFPDNYFFCGPRTEQYHQVGNAVPPLLAKQIAEIVAKIVTS